MRARMIACVRCTGSPFTVEVVDPGTVLARGDGLICGQAHHQAVFTVGTDNGAGVNVGDCRISVYGIVATARNESVPKIIINDTIVFS